MTAVLPLTANASQVTAKPARTTLRASEYGPNAYFINGSILTNAFLALAAVEHDKGALADNGWLMQMTDDGRYFNAAPSSNDPIAVTVQVIDGRASLVVSSMMPPASATIDLGALRAIRAAYNFFQTQTGLPPGGDRALSSYDVLVHPSKAGQYNARYAGKLFVWLLHHKDPNVRSTFAGCFDGSGYEKEYLVDPGTFAVIALPCR
ncbi:MAG TPA: hypothetical protein VFO29_11425 [Candidatus Rubrimentiphilum sp.]|nr:hypothetical protein [Candidatus Rubrimentiphilum sp.]